MITVVCYIIGLVITEFLNYLLKRLIIKTGQVNEETFKMLKTKTALSSNLKWALILLFGGIGLLCVGFFPYQFSTSAIPWGIEAIFIALGLFLYILINRKYNISQLQ